MAIMPERAPCIVPIAGTGLADHQPATRKATNEAGGMSRFRSGVGWAIVMKTGTATTTRATSATNPATSDRTQRNGGAAVSTVSIASLPSRATEQDTISRGAMDKAAAPCSHAGGGEG